MLCPCVRKRKIGLRCALGRVYLTLIFKMMECSSLRGFHPDVNVVIESSDQQTPQLKERGTRQHLFECLRLRM